MLYGFGFATSGISRTANLMAFFMELWRPVGRLRLADWPKVSERIGPIFWQVSKLSELEGTENRLELSNWVTGLNYLQFNFIFFL